MDPCLQYPTINTDHDAKSLVGISSNTRRAEAKSPALTYTTTMAFHETWVLDGMEVKRDSAAGTAAKRAWVQSKELNETASGAGMLASAACAAGRSLHLA
jgi:hypothetical protein